MLNSCFLGQTYPIPQGVHVGDRNAAGMGQQPAIALQRSHSSRDSVPGHEWNASHQPSHARPGHAVSVHNVQDQHRYVHGQPGEYRCLSRCGVPALMLNNLKAQPSARDMPRSSSNYREGSSNNICKLPDCSQPSFFHPQIQEQLDYCQAHLVYVSTFFYALHHF